MENEFTERRFSRREASRSTSTTGRCCDVRFHDQTGFKLQALRIRVANKTLVCCAANRTQTNRLRHLVPHLCDAAARHDDGHTHLSRLDDHFAGQAAGCVEDKAFRLRIRRRGTSRGGSFLASRGHGTGFAGPQAKRPLGGGGSEPHAVGSVGAELCAGPPPNSQAGAAEPA